MLQHELGKHLYVTEAVNNSIWSSDPIPGWAELKRGEGLWRYFLAAAKKQWCSQHLGLPAEEQGNQLVSVAVAFPGFGHIAVSGSITPCWARLVSLMQLYCSLCSCWFVQSWLNHPGMGLTGTQQMRPEASLNMYSCCLICQNITT